MNRSTRLLSQVYSPDSHRFFTFGGHKTLAFTPRVQISPPKFRKIISFATKTGNLNTNIPAMDPNRPESSEPHGSANEDFIHVENPNLYVEEALSESIVDVDNELREENANTGSDSEPERKELPEELSRSVVKLTCESAAEGGLCDVYLVGTAHVSQESCEEVRAIIRYLKPEVVFLELCTRRLAVLTPQNLKVADKLEVFPGSEFRVGFEEARAYGGKVILGDRPVQITLRRTWAKMPLWHKTKLLYSLIFQAVFLPDPEDLNKMLKEMDNVDMLTLVIQEMSKEFPTLMETLVHERDQYMSSTLLKVASEHTSVVAVVGKGHLQGIKRHWRQPVPVKDLLDMPSQKPAISALKVLTSLGVAVSGVAIIWGIYRACKK
ncbi:traB domain-containing protein isoform X2 [Ricinus communis]|uniref:traB domain-containing protein isoform X2 n=1 Tax=Ricinus communis TaxID=3988 RepID=UPI00201B0885|nr:traB domain-containing protein isoform X2 [Ricinus communis]